MRFSVRSLRLRTFFIFERKEMIFVADYKKMYLSLLDKVETALEVLNEAKLSCEEIYIETDDTVEQ